MRHFRYATNTTVGHGYCRTVAAGVCAALLLGGCGIDHEEPPATPQPEKPAAATQTSGEGRSLNYYDDNSQSPQRDQSVDNSLADTSAMAQFAMIELATAAIEPTQGNNAEGAVEFRPGEDNTGMLVTVKISGLEPGRHGFHIHQVGDCSAPDASSAGGHFNPYETSHGGPADAEHHVGDMGNIEANDEGRVDTELQFDHLAFSGPASILNKAVVIHAGADDLEADPSGAAGSRVGCGVIATEPDILADSKAQ